MCTGRNPVSERTDVLCPTAPLAAYAPPFAAQPVAAAADVADQPGRDAGDQPVGRYVPVHDRAGADERPGADGDAGDQDRAGADRRAVLDPDLAELPLVGAQRLALGVDRPRVVVVGDHCGWPDEDPLAEPSAVVDQRVVLDLAALADLD